MADITQLPGNLNIATTIYDDLSILLDFNIALTGYTFSSKIVKDGAETTITVTNTSLATGQITLSVANTVLAGVGAGNHDWYLSWITNTAVDRRVLIGKFTLQA